MKTSQFTEEQILNTDSLVTIVDGRVVYGW